MIRLIITQGGELVADIPDYEGPVPRAGEYISRPRGMQPRPMMLDSVMSVKTVTYGILARPQDKETGHFIGAAEPFAEVVV